MKNRERECMNGEQGEPGCDGALTENLMCQGWFFFIKLGKQIKSFYQNIIILIIYESYHII